MIKYYSTEGKSPNVSFKEALLSGLAPDRGLYMPDKIKQLNDRVFKQNDFAKMSFEIAKILADGEIPDHALKKIVDDAFNFCVPVKNIHNNIYVLELFHGPTAAFKDFGARFMARTMSYLIKGKNQKITILVATSGDTGSAVAKGFYDVENIDVVLLYPKGKVSFLQEKQLTTSGKNITALEVRGTFDDCQYMVKEAFIDKELNSKLLLSSANSINIGRLLPQSFYYVWAYIKVNKEKKSPVIFCTPSGNFGNLTGGLIAKAMGLPVELFIAATNINDVVPEYLDKGIFTPRPSIPTYSNAMDVGNPSNFSRMLALYKTKKNMSKDIIGFKVTDEETLNTINKVYKKHDYILDPHGAVAYKAVIDFWDKYDKNDI
ncbi:MAG: threonine synthase, partial [Spirochaetes bacterium]|nr:threonine synthase [Spirochaetota bacterium]